jgi:hypothetical protein
MKFGFLKKFSLPKLVGRFGVLIVDIFSTLIFFMLQGESWVLTTTGLIFAITKVWHWQQSFAAVDKLRRYLHRGAWFLMAVLSVYFLITLGLSITLAPEEAAVDRNIFALEEAIAKSRVANVEALTREQDSLLRQNDSLTERMLTLNQWSQAWEPLQAQINANLARLGAIAVELNNIYAEQTQISETRITEREKEDTTVLKFRAVKPIGAQGLMARVMPDSWIDASIVLLFFLVGIVMEITLALSSLSEEKRLHCRPEDPPAEKADKHIPMQEIPPIQERPMEKPTEKISYQKLTCTPAPVQEETRELKLDPEAEKQMRGEFREKAAQARKDKGEEQRHRSLLANERKGCDAGEITAYIDAAYDGGRLKPDSEVEGVPETDCRRIREYLQSFKLRGKIIVEEINGAYIVRLDKESLKKFIALQCSVQRV